MAIFVILVLIGATWLLRILIEDVCYVLYGVIDKLSSLTLDTQKKQ